MMTRMRLQLEIILELSKYKPLPTCNKDNGKFLQKYKVLPLTRAQDFLKILYVVRRAHWAIRQS